MKAKILMMAGCLAAMGAAMAQDINCKDMSNYNICQLNGIRDIGSSGSVSEVPQRQLGQIGSASVQNGSVGAAVADQQRQAALLEIVKKAPIPAPVPFYAGVQGSGSSQPASTSGSRWTDLMEQQGMVQKDGVWVLKNGGGENMSALMEINGYGWSKIKESWVPFNPEKRNTYPEFADFMKKQGFVLSGNSWVPGNTGSYSGVQNTKPQPTVTPATNQGGYAGVQGSGSSQPASTSGSRWTDLMEQQGMVQKDGVWVLKNGGGENMSALMEINGYGWSKIKESWVPFNPEKRNTNPEFADFMKKQGFVLSGNSWVPGNTGSYGGVQNTKPQPTVTPATNQGGYAGVQGSGSSQPASTSGSRWADVMEQQGMVQKDGVWVQKSAPSYGGVQNTKPQPTVTPATNQGGYAGVQGGNSPAPVIQFKYPMDRGS